MLDKIGGRKLVVTLVGLGLAVIMALIKGDVPEHLQTLIEVVIGTYVTGNIARAHVASRANDPMPSSTEKVDLSGVTQSLEEIKAASTNQAQGLTAIQDMVMVIMKRAGIIS